MDAKDDLSVFETPDALMEGRPINCDLAEKAIATRTGSCGHFQEVALPKAISFYLPLI